MTIKPMYGDLRVHKFMVPGTFQHAHQIFHAQTTEDTTILRTPGGFPIYTADGVMYSMQGEEPVLAITNREQNIALKITGYNNSQQRNPSENLVESILKDHDTVVVNLHGLELSQENVKKFQVGRIFNGDRIGYDPRKYFIFDPKKMNDLNQDQRAVVQKMLGPENDDFETTSEILERNGEKLYICTFSPEFVRDKLLRNENSYATFSTLQNKYNVGWIFNMLGSNDGATNMCLIGELDESLRNAYRKYSWEVGREEEYLEELSKTGDWQPYEQYCEDQKEREHIWDEFFKNLDKKRRE